MANLVDHVFHHLAGILDQVDNGKQDLSIGLAELLDDGGRLAGSASHDVVSFLHGGRLLSDSCLATGFYRIGSQPPPTNLQLNSGRLRRLVSSRRYAWHYPSKQLLFLERTLRGRGSTHQTV